MLLLFHHLLYVIDIERLSFIAVKTLKKSLMHNSAFVRWALGVGRFWVQFLCSDIETASPT